MNGISAAIVVSSWIASLTSGAEPTVWVRVPDPATTRPEIKEASRWTRLADPSLGPASVERWLANAGGTERLSAGAPKNRGRELEVELELELEQSPTLLVFSHSNKGWTPAHVPARSHMADRKKWRALFPDSHQADHADAKKSEPSAHIEVLARDFDSFDQITALLKLSRARIVTQARARFGLAASLIAADFAATKAAQALIVLDEKDDAQSPVVNVIGRLDRPNAALQWLRSGRKIASGNLSGEFQLILSANGGIIFAARLSKAGAKQRDSDIEAMSRNMLKAWLGPELADSFRIRTHATHAARAEPNNRLVVLTLPEADGSEPAFSLLRPETKPAPETRTRPASPKLSPLSIEVAVDRLVAAATARGLAQIGPAFRPSTLLGLRVGFGRFLARTRRVRLTATVRGASMQMDGEVSYRL